MAAHAVAGRGGADSALMSKHLSLRRESASEVTVPRSCDPVANEEGRSRCPKVRADHSGFVTERRRLSVVARVLASIAVLTLAMALAVLCGLWLMHTVVRPIVALDRHAEQLSAGNPPTSPLSLHGARDERGRGQ